jgi:P-type Ca2+ transporter type 2C
VTELYTVDEIVNVDISTSTSARPTQAVLKTLEIGSLCNNAIYRHEEAAYVGHSVDVALLNVLPIFGLSDQRVVSRV